MELFSKGNALLRHVLNG
ncbi:BnaA07g09670D [Brassica napus]|uniref:BnaA07g09670D protein n=1 Tax=Brassica napus TaxID=3708 RepID=A0A078GH78_BRANA|nr:BnaA07g09670D [Brassica napus]